MGLTYAPHIIRESLSDEKKGLIRYFHAYVLGNADFIIVFAVAISPVHKRKTLEFKKGSHVFLKMSGFMFLLPQGSFKQRLAAFAPQDAIVGGVLFPQQYCVTFGGAEILEIVVIMWRNLKPEN